jgi:WD40 repeat protein
MDRSARIWTSEGTQIALLEGDSQMEMVAWSPDGTRLVTTSMKPAAEIWQADGTSVAKLTGHRYEITSVAWSSDGSRLLSTTIHEGARLWSADGLLLATLEHGAAVTSASFGPGDTHVVTAGSDGRLRIWLVDAAQLLRGFWSSTPRCLDIGERQRVLAESRADAEFGAGACRAMHDCLRDDVGEVVAARFDACLDEFHARREAYYF